MKKVFFMASAIALMAFTSCGSKTDKTAEATTDSTEVVAPAGEDVVETLATQLKNNDAEGLATTIAEVKTKYAELVSAGKLDEAKAYAAQAQQYLKEHSAEITAIAGEDSQVSTLVNTIVSLPTSASATAEEAAKAIESKASETVEAAKAGVKAQGEAVKAELTNKVEAKKAEAKQKANDAAAKANQKINEKTQEAAKKANDAVNNAAKKALEGLMK